MRQNTRLKFNQMCDKLAASYGVPSMNVQFAVEPTLQQRLQDKIVEQSTFLPKINIVPVDELAGENVLGSASGPVSGRSDTTKDSVERVPRDVLGLVSYKYQLKQTNSDVFMRYATMDAWAKFPDMAERYARYVQARIANDRELVGWYGTSAADTTDLSSNPLLQDVNKGWLQYIRDAIPQNILAEGETTGELRIGSEDGADWANLDVAVNDLVQGIPTYMRTGLVALIGTELIAREKAALLAQMGRTPTEKAAINSALVSFGGLPWESPSNFPARGLVVTSYDNLSIYVQDGSWRRHILDNPKKDRVEDALNATRAAVEEGIIPGGGTAFVRTIKVLDDIKPADDDELAGLNIVRRSLEEPLRLIAGNAGHEGSVVVEKVREGKDGFGFNAATGEYEDLIKAGVIDPKKVARIALQNAASVASLLLTTECAIAEKPEPKKDMPAMPDMGGMGGMGGMY